MAANDDVEADVHQFLKEYNQVVRSWTDQVLAPTTAPSAVTAKKAVLTALYQVPSDLEHYLPRLAGDLRTWQEAVDTVARSGPESPDRRVSQRLARVATATSGQLQQRIGRLRFWSMGLAVVIMAAAGGWSVSVARRDSSAIAATAILLLTGCAVLAFCLPVAYGRLRALVLTTFAGAAALFTPGVAGMLFRNGAVDAWGWLLVAGGVTLVVGGGLWFTSLPRDVRPTGRLQHLQRLTDELWPPADQQQRRSPPTVPEPSGEAVDRRTLGNLLDQLEEEIADRERAHRRASRTWQGTHVVLASLAALTAGAAGVINQTEQPQLWATILAASAAALSGLFAALNPGKRQEDNRLTALGAQALRRELRVLRERDIHHDNAVRTRVREALEDLTIRFEAILGRPAEPTFWRRSNPEGQPRPMTTTAAEHGE